MTITCIWVLFLFSLFYSNMMANLPRIDGTGESFGVLGDLRDLSKSFFPRHPDYLLILRLINVEVLSFEMLQIINK